MLQPESSTRKMFTATQLVLSILATVVSSKQTKYHLLEDDILLTHEQLMMIKERGFYVPGKWPMRKRKVTIPYYFDDAMPQGDPKRATFKQAADVFKSITCIEWEETTKTDSRHKVKIYPGNSCSSHVGMIHGEDNVINLDTDCRSVNLMLHEMSHTVGLEHTQSRPDRDQYVDIWYQNVKVGHEKNFEIEMDSKTYGVPYDYLSVMHYANYYFSKNGSFTLTTKDPNALFIAGSRINKFRWSDAALINKGYRCPEIFLKTCTPKNCLNGGYVGKNCSCYCPENTQGEFCEKETEPFFAYTPLCGKRVVTPEVIHSYGRDMRECIYVIDAPPCNKIQITIEEAKLHSADCRQNIFALQYSKTYFGSTFCDTESVPIGSSYLSDSRRAGVYFSAIDKPNEHYGFKVNIQFIEDTTCDAHSTTTASSTTIQTNTPIITKPPVGPCKLTEYIGYRYKYSTPGFPNIPKTSQDCQIEFKQPQKTSIMLSKIEFKIMMKIKETLTIKDAVGRKTTYTGSDDAKPVLYALWPMTIEFKAAVMPGRGFELQIEPARSLPYPCNFNVIHLEVGDSKIVTNPFLTHALPDAKCAFLVQCNEDNKIEFITNRIQKGTIYVNPNLPVSDKYIEIVNDTYTSRKNFVLIYSPEQQNGNWEIQFTVI